MPSLNQPLRSTGGSRLTDQPRLDWAQGKFPEPVVGGGSDGAELYRVVETYAAFGDHLTGSEADSATTEWLADHLRNLGATVELPSFEFERYVCTAHLSSGGEVVPIAPLFYSGYGRWETGNVQVIQLDKSTVAGEPTSLAPLIEGPAGSRALALALNGPDDQPVWCNRVPAAQGFPTGPGQPCVIIPSNWADRVRGDARLSFDGSLETASSRNIVATLGSPERRRVTITAPLTGWTSGAGERGTGIAAALALAQDLATEYYVVLILGSGDELDHQGTRSYLFANDLSGQPVIHLGAAVGAVERLPDGDAVLEARRGFLTTASQARSDGLARRAAAGRFTLLERQDWPGEATTWREVGASLLSFLGTFEHSHLATDQPEVSTTAPALAVATDAIISTARYFLDPFN